MPDQDHQVGPRRLHGRRQETEMLDAALRALAVADRGGVMMIEGERGAGRTALLDAATQRAHAQGVVFLRSVAVAAERSMPLRPLLDALDEHDLSADAIARQLEQLTARAPVVVAIDDLHEADDFTLRAVRGLVDRTAGRRLLWLLTLAPGRADTTAQALGRSAGGTVMRLGPLAGDAIRALTHDVLGARPSRAVLDLVEDLGGHPADTVELLTALVDERLIEITDDIARLTGQGLRYALCDLGIRHPPVDAGRPPHAVLTRSELAVAELVARGATNRQAAEQLFLSPHTVSTHLRHAFEKLDIRSRIQLAILFADTTSAA